MRFKGDLKEFFYLFIVFFDEIFIDFVLQKLLINGKLDFV